MVPCAGVFKATICTCCHHIIRQNDAITKGRKRPTKAFYTTFCPFYGTEY